jgi:hypothetical protein
MPDITPVPIIEKVIDDCTDRKRMSAGIDACQKREKDFRSALEMQLAGIAMIPEARARMTEKLSESWNGQQFKNGRIILASGNNVIPERREIIIGGGLHAAIYAASRVRMGFPKPIVLERGSGQEVGGAFAVSMNPVFRLNSRTRPGTAGLPDQDKALNYIPGGLLQPDMVTSEEYIDNSLMAWLIRLTLAQYAIVIPSSTVTRIDTPGRRLSQVRLADGTPINAGRVLDARGLGGPKTTSITSDFVLSFPQFMARMGTMFPLRGMQQVAVIGGGNSGLCAAESLLGIAPGHSSAIGLDYVQRVDLYAKNGIDGATCTEFRAGQRGRYIRLAQFLEGNASSPSTRLRVIPTAGYATPMPDGVIVNERTYDMAIRCTGYAIQADLTTLSFSFVRKTPTVSTGTVLATRAAPYQVYRIGVAADIPFSAAETDSGISDNPANKISIFRTAPRTAALATILPAVDQA